MTDARGTSAETPSEQIVTDGNGISLKDNPVVATVVITGLLSQSSYIAYDLDGIQEDLNSIKDVKLDNFLNIPNINQ